MHLHGHRRAGHSLLQAIPRLPFCFSMSGLCGLWLARPSPVWLQGSVLLTKVLADCVDCTEHQSQFIAAYLAV